MTLIHRILAWLGSLLDRHKPTERGESAKDIGAGLASWFACGDDSDDPPKDWSEPT